MLSPRSIASLVILLAAVQTVADAGFGQPRTEAEAFFSGTVVDNSPDRVTVTRAIQGRKPEQRTFIINADTTIEGSLKHNSRVTVRFAAGEEGDIALTIIVRERPERNPKRGRSQTFRSSSRGPAFLYDLSGTSHRQ